MTWSRFLHFFSAEKKSHNKVSLEEFKNCLNKLEGNWPTLLDIYPYISKDLQFYLHRYVKGGLTFIPVVSTPETLEITKGVYSSYQVKQPIYDHKREILHTFAVAPFYSEHYPTSLQANCLIYFANSLKELTDIHANTLIYFKQGLNVASEAFKNSKEKGNILEYPVPPIFLIITDPNSELIAKDALANAPVPILHALHVPNSMLPMRGDTIQPTVIESLLKNTIAPCYENLSELFGLIPKAKLNLNDVVGYEIQGNMGAFSSILTHFDGALKLARERECLVESEDDTDDVSDEQKEESMPDDENLTASLIPDGCESDIEEIVYKPF